MLASITGGYKTTAKVAGNKLVLSFPDAENPSVWSLDLAEAMGCLFEIEESKAIGGYDLVRQEGKSKKVIARFDSRSKAMNALVKTTKALENVTVNNSNAAGQAPVIVQTKGSFPILKILFLIALAYVAVMIFMSSSTGPSIPTVAVGPQSTAPSSAAQEAQQPQEPAAGVPLSAEEYLNQQ